MSATVWTPWNYSSSKESSNFELPMPLDTMGSQRIHWGNETSSQKGSDTVWTTTKNVYTLDVTKGKVISRSVTFASG